MAYAPRDDIETFKKRLGTEGLESRRTHLADAKPVFELRFRLRELRKGDEEVRRLGIVRGGRADRRSTNYNERQGHAPQEENRGV